MLHLERKNNRYPYSIGGATLIVVNNFFDLGFLVTEDLDKQCAMLANMTSNAMQNLFQLCSFEHSKSTQDPYCSSAVFSPHLRNSVEVFESVQKKKNQNAHDKTVSLSILRSYNNNTCRNLGFDLQILEHRRTSNDVILYDKVVHHMIRIECNGG